MKKILIVIAGMFICSTLMAKIMGTLFSPEPFDVQIIKHDNMLQIDNKDFPELGVNQTFTDSRKSYQLRYSFFKQDDGVAAEDDIRLPFSMYILPMMLNVSGREMANGKVTRFNDADVNKEFNGDFGTTVFIERPRSEFGKGYKYVMMNFYCKRNHGIVVQSILFNNLNFVRDRIYEEVFHSFKFNE